MMAQRCENGFKLRKLNDLVEEDKVMQIESNIIHEKNLLSEPEAGLVPQTTETTTEVKATVEIKEDSRITVLECFGDLHHKKKVAAEQAAEAALWYLKNVVHTLLSEKPSGRQGQTKPI